MVDLGTDMESSMTDVVTSTLAPVERKYLIKFMGFDEGFITKARMHIQGNVPLAEPVDPHDIVKKKFGIILNKHDSVPTAIKWILFASQIKDCDDEDFRQCIRQEHKLSCRQLREYYNDEDLNPVPSSFLKSFCNRNVEFKIGSLLKYNQSRIAGNSLQTFASILEEKYWIDPIEKRFEGFHGNIKHYNILPKCTSALRECAGLIIEEEKYNIIERARKHLHGSN